MIHWVGWIGEHHQGLNIGWLAGPRIVLKIGRHAWYIRWRLAKRPDRRLIFYYSNG